MTLTTILLIACTAASAVAVALLVFLLKRERKETRRLNAAIRLFEEKIGGVKAVCADDLQPIERGVGSLREQIAGIVNKPPVPPGDPVLIEHQVLAESWKQFLSNQELSAALDGALQDRAWGTLLDELKAVVPAELKPAFDAVIVPCREHRTLVQKLDLIPRLVSGKIPRLGTAAEEVRRTRELAMLLTGDATTRLDFRIRQWVTDAFLPFADLYLQRCQQAQLDSGSGELQTGAALVRQVLQLAAVEPIEVTPGETPFDSARHIGRSTSNDPRFADGVITGVVRNGFIEGGQQVIRQPEVIVNRMR